MKVADERRVQDAKNAAMEVLLHNAGPCGR